MISRPFQRYTTAKPPAWCAKAIEDAEADFNRAAERAERLQMCLSLIAPTPPTGGRGGCEVQAPSFEVTPGGLTYQDAALQCLREGGHRTLEEISRSITAI